jgi:hypothetical protein
MVCDRTGTLDSVDPDEQCRWSWKMMMWRGYGRRRGDEPDETGENSPTQRTLLQILDKLKTQPSLWNDVLSTMFPNDADLSKLPTWVCAVMRVHAGQASIRTGQIPELKDQVSRRFQRLPSLSVTTFSIETCRMLSPSNIDGHSPGGCWFVILILLTIRLVPIVHGPSVMSWESSPIKRCLPLVAGCINYIRHDVCFVKVPFEGMLSIMDLTTGNGVVVPAVALVPKRRV